jgi:hypothetical protein
MSNSTAPATSTIILSAASEHFVKNAPVTIAPWILGASFDLFLQGKYAVSTIVHAICTRYLCRLVDSHRSPQFFINRYSIRSDDKLLLQSGPRE